MNLRSELNFKQLLLFFLALTLLFLLIWVFILYLGLINEYKIPFLIINLLLTISLIGFLIYKSTTIIRINLKFFIQNKIIFFLLLFTIFNFFIAKNLYDTEIKEKKLLQTKLHNEEIEFNNKIALARNNFSNNKYREALNIYNTLNAKKLNSIDLKNINLINKKINEDAIKENKKKEMEVNLNIIKSFKAEEILLTMDLNKLLKLSFNNNYGTVDKDNKIILYLNSLTELLNKTKDNNDLKVKKEREIFKDKLIKFQIKIFPKLRKNATQNSFNDMDNNGFYNSKYKIFGNKNEIIILINYKFSLDSEARKIFDELKYILAIFRFRAVGFKWMELEEEAHFRGIISKKDNEL